MPHAQLITDLSIMLGVAAVVTFLFRVIRQPVVLGYVIAGMIVGPFTPGPQIGDTASIKVWAELGVIMLMFALGLEFSFRKLARVGATATITGVAQIVTMFGLGMYASGWLGWNRIDGIFLGSMIAISSTTIIIKAFEEARVRGQRFTDYVFGILIVEDLAAILILVGLSSLAAKSTIDALGLARSAMQLLLVTGSWMFLGLFLVPRLVRAVGKRGTNEMLVITAMALCLGLVTLASTYEYSVALGAFIMGSILAETAERKRIEHLVEPLRDLFGAIFFVSVGMLFDPRVIWQQPVAVLVVTALIVVGKIVSVSLASLATGQNVQTSVKIGLSMAQIGEFSFIIAGLGLTLGVMRPDLYGVIVASSLVTTFLTPYLIKASPSVGQFFEDTMPSFMREGLDRYVMWIDRSSRLVGESREEGARGGIRRWIILGLLTVIIYAVGVRYGIPAAARVFEVDRAMQNLIAWSVSTVFALPFMYGMATAFSGDGREKLLTPRRMFGIVATAFVFVVMSFYFFATWTSLLAMFGVGMVIAVLLRDRLSKSYDWYERRFLGNLQQRESGVSAVSTMLASRLSPWQAHLVDMEVGVWSEASGRSILDLQIREVYGVNIIGIQRAGRFLMPPQPSEILLPGDRLLCFGLDQEVARLRSFVEVLEAPVIKARVAVAADAPEAQSDVEEIAEARLKEFDVKALPVSAGHPLAERTIRESGLREQFGAVVVGVERGGQRIRNPHSDLKFAVGDVVWVVATIASLGLVEENYAAAGVIPS